jgi:hypothetical protein
MMQRLRQSKPDDETPDGVEPTPAGVDLAARYGYSDATKASGGEIRRASRGRIELLFQRDLPQ